VVLNQLNKALVVRSTGSWYELMLENQSVIKARLKGKLKLKGLKTTNPVAVGDWVLFQTDSITGDHIISDIVERKNYIIRKSPKSEHHAHIIASNIDLAIVLVTLVFPKTSIGFIDRFLVVAQSYQIPALVLINKVDMLSDPESKEIVDDFEQIYSKAGYQTMQISALNGQGIATFLELIEGKKCLLVGHSGAGKSTLTNAIISDLQIHTQEVSQATGKGLHTTTFAQMHTVNPNTFIIDTPGIRELGVMDINEGELAFYFPDFIPYLSKCKYNNCTHVHEPDCMVKKAVSKGKIGNSRYESYLSILANHDNRA